MKIVIIGGGIAGLSTYLQLLKHLPNPSTHSITIFESHRPRPKPPSSSQPSTYSSLPQTKLLTIDALSSSTALVGGGLGISPNGMRVLRLLDPELAARFTAQGFRAENFVFRGANGWVLGVQEAGDSKTRREVAKEKGKGDGDGSGEGEEVCISSSRHGLWETLFWGVEQKGGKEGVVRYAKALGVERTESGRIRVRVEENGEEKVEEAELVIGADGVKSVVRKSVFGDVKDGRYDPVYSGQSGVGGFLNVPIPSYVASNACMVFTFGGNGFFGYAPSSPASSQQLQWWSTYETPNLPSSSPLDPTAIKAALLERHKHWRDPIIQDIVQKAEVQSINPTWTLPTLPHWGEKGIVLMGDAAHAMDPTTGQGASQAMEDAETLAVVLGKMIERDRTGEEVVKRETVDEAIKVFHDVRAPRVNKIVARGKKIAGSKASMGVVAEYFMYGFLWLLNHVPAIGKLIIGDVNRELYCWSAEEEVDKVLRKRV